MGKAISKATKAVTKPIKSLGQGAIDITRGVGGAAVNVVKGDSIRDDLGNIGGGLTKTINMPVELMTAGQSKSIDEKTGGAYSKTLSANATFGNLIAGKSVTQNLKDAGSIAIQAGTQVVSANGGVNAGGFDLTGLFNNVMSGLDAKLQGIQNTNAQPSQTQGSYNGDVAPQNNNILPIVLISGVVIVGAVLLFKKK